MKILRQQFLEHVAQTSPSPLMIEVARASGVFLWTPPTDEYPDGQRFFDLISGVSVSNVGHGRAEVVQAVQEQAAAYMHTMVYGEMVEAPQVRYAARLAELLPPSLQSVYFVNSGAEAIEGALKLAKRATGRREILAFRRAYHGSTHGGLSVMSSPEGDEWRAPFEPLLSGTDWLIFNDFDGLARISRETACVLVEPVQGEGGVRLPAPGFLAALRKRCDETGTLLIFDEIQTGMGRTGTLFAFERYGGPGTSFAIGQYGDEACRRGDSADRQACTTFGQDGGEAFGQDSAADGQSGQSGQSVPANGQAVPADGQSAPVARRVENTTMVVPDILCVAKAFGGGMPLGAFIASRETMGLLSHDPALGHITTFGGNPVCCAAGLAALEVLLDEDNGEVGEQSDATEKQNNVAGRQNLIAAVEAKGALYEQLLAPHPAVKEIRRAGLLMAVELGDAAKMYRIMELFRERGILSDWFLFCDTAFRISPPLVVTEDEIRESCEIIIRCLNELN